MDSSFESIIVERGNFSLYSNLLWAYQAELINPAISGATVKTRSKKNIFAILQEDITLIAEQKMPAGIVIVNRYKTILEAQAKDDFSFSILHDKNIEKELGKIQYEIILDDPLSDEEEILQNKVKIASYHELVNKIEQTASIMEQITKKSYKSLEEEIEEDEIPVEEIFEEIETKKKRRRRKRELIRRLFSKIGRIIAALGRVLKRAIRGKKR